MWMRQYLFANLQMEDFCLLDYPDETCSPNFYLVADTLVPHHYWGINTSTAILPLSYYWSWGDGASDTAAYPSHTYSTGGFYNICLSIYDSGACIDTVCTNYEVLK